MKTAADYFGPLTELATAKGFQSGRRAARSFPLGATTTGTREISAKRADTHVRQTSLVMSGEGYEVSFTFIGGSEDEINELIEKLSFAARKPPTNPTCHPERSGRFASRSSRAVEGPALDTHAGFASGNIFTKAGMETHPKTLPSKGSFDSDQRMQHDVKGHTAGSYSSASGSSPISFSPAAFFSMYFFTQASQLFPAAVSRPVKASAAISE